MPAVAGVSTSVPMRTITDMATTGAVGFSRTSAMSPFGSVSRVTGGALAWAAAGRARPVTSPARADRTAAASTTPVSAGRAQAVGLGLIAPLPSSA
jgi:hypothetical protein